LPEGHDLRRWLNLRQKPWVQTLPEGHDLRGWLNLRQKPWVQTLPEGHDLRRCLNHLFQHCVTGEVSEYKNIEETFSPEVISRMISWLKAL